MDPLDSFLNEALLHPSSALLMAVLWMVLGTVKSVLYFAVEGLQNFFADRRALKQRDFQSSAEIERTERDRQELKELRRRFGVEEPLYREWSDE